MGQLENLARERIIRWRKENGVSQDRLGQLTNTHQTTVGKWENGIGTMDIDTLATWARFFGRTLFDLIAHEDAEAIPHGELIAAYNAAPPEAQKAILGLLKTFLPDTKRDARSAPKRAGKRGTGSA